MRRTMPLLATMALTLLVASGLALAAGVGSAAAQSSVVGPGESIQKAVNAADSGDTIVVRGVHREDVVIGKDGIKLRGEDAVIEAPAKADSPCSRFFGPEAICVLGDVNFKHYIKTNEVNERVKDVSVSGFTIRGLKGEGKGRFAIDVLAAHNATVVGNHATGNVTGGIVVGGSVNTTVTKNHVTGSPETDAEGIFVEGDARNTTVVKNDVRSIPEDQDAIEVNEGIDTTIEGNDLVGDWLGVSVFDSPGTKILSNVVSHFGIVGTFVAGQKSEDSKLVGNDISGGPWGIYVQDAHGGSVLGNKVHDNCAGMFFEAIFGPVGGFKVTGNTVENNTHSCRGQKFGRKFSGIGIALLGARDMEVTGNGLSDNVPSGPTAVSGGVVVSTDPYFGVKAKPMNNSIIGNHFGRNKPDIFYDGSDTGNRFVGNLCDTSVPTRLCN
jgi:parallel beta-helix repeat protein